MGKTGTIGHLDLSVEDYEASKKFYSFLLVDLMGYKNVMEEPYCTMWTNSIGEMIAISPGNNTPHHKSNPGIHHLAFNAETRELIDEFHTKIVDYQSKNVHAKSTILDKPADYPQYVPGYYAVFFTDPDGIKLEIAYKPDTYRQN
ncbi:hypothetical protein EMPS_05947 [Entomortierella parvispora]|uniref:VOC domain-containing protein n=1 Tax=Entomortierella parvispora TaxID=205924 RepID=A0A9P3HBC7_9FUNG|nr:hypothetical protein EMPS_05947 [Entomortierella parvispora]